MRESGTNTADAYVLVEVLGMLFDARKGALPDVLGPATDLERFAHDHGFTSFYWFDALRAVLERVEEAAVRTPMIETLARLTVILGPQSRLALERRTDAPPDDAL